jgi:hypothetical protein
MSERAAGEGISRARLILVAGWTLFVVHAYPGLVSPEAIAQLGGARSGEWVSGVEPAAVTALWSVIDFVIAGPFGMVAAASLCLLAGTFSLAKRGLSKVDETSAANGRKPIEGREPIERHAPIEAIEGHAPIEGRQRLRGREPIDCGLRVERLSAFIAVGVLLFPPVLVGMSIASGFMLFAGFAVFGLALIASDCRWARVVGLALFTLATTMRFGGWVGTLPLVFAMPLTGSIVRRVGIALVLWAATFAMAFGLGRVVEDRDTRERTTTINATISTDATTFGEALVAIPSPTSRDSQSLDSLRELEIQVGYARVQGATDAVMRGLRFMMIPIFWGVLGLALLVWLRRDRVLRWLLASGLAVEASQFYFAADGLYERSHWLVATVTISGAIAIVRALQREPDPA